MSITHTPQSAIPNSNNAALISSTSYNAAHLNTDYYNLKDRGGAGDGSANDTTALTNLIATVVAAGGGDIFIPRGLTFLTDRVVHSTAGITLRFFGGGTLRLRTTSDSLIKCNNATATVILDDVRLDGNNLALTNATCGLASVFAGQMVGKWTEVFNVGTAASGTSGGFASSGGGKLMVYGCHLHDIRGFPVHVQGTGKFLVAYNDIHDCGNTAVMCDGGGTPQISDGGLVSDNDIRHILADLGGSGANGNGINIYQLDGVTVGPNSITDVAFSFLRVTVCNHFSVTGGTWRKAGETGAFIAELGSTRCSMSGVNLDDIQGYGVVVTNLPSVYGCPVTGCVVTNFGQRGAGQPSGGIAVEGGLVENNYVDGGGNAGATWALKCSPGGNTAVSWQTQVQNNQTAGCKYDVGVAATATAGTQRMVITGNNRVRQDANFSSPIGAIGASDSDAGNGSAIASSIYPFIMWDRNYWNVPTAEAPTGGEVGSTMKINGAWKTIANGTTTPFV